MKKSYTFELFMPGGAYGFMAYVILYGLKTAVIALLIVSVFLNAWSLFLE